MVGTTLVPHSYIANGQRLQKIPPPFPLDLVFTIVPCCRREKHTVQKLDKVPICIYVFAYVLLGGDLSLIQGSPTSTVSTSMIYNSTNFRAIGIKSVLVELLPDCYVVKFVLVEIGYVVPTSTNFT